MSAVVPNLGEATTMVLEFEYVVNETLIKWTERNQKAKRRYKGEGFVDLNNMFRNKLGHGIPVRVRNSFTNRFCKSFI